MYLEFAFSLLKIMYVDNWIDFVGKIYARAEFYLGL
jgi:hypothetical protein